MNTFVVERDMWGVTLDELAAAKQVAARQVRIMREAGTSVRYLRTTFMPDDGRCMCLFEAHSADDVRRLNDDAGLPYIQVVPAYDLDPRRLETGGRRGEPADAVGPAAAPE